MASSSGREELAGSQPSYNVYSSLTRQRILDPNRVACCYFKAKSGKGSLNASGQGILLQLPNESTPLAVVTSHQLIPSMVHAKQWLIGFDPKKKEFDLEEYLNSSQAELITCCGEEHSLWENTDEHSDKKCPLNGDFTILLLGAGLSNEIYSTFGNDLDMLSIDDCMDFDGVQQLMKNRSVVSVYQRMAASCVLQTSLIIPPQTEIGYNSLTQNVEMYQNSYSSFPFDTQLSQAQLFSVTGAPIMYTDPLTRKNQLLGMHTYLPFQSVQYGVSLSHILAILRSSAPRLCPLHQYLHVPRRGHIPILCLLYQNVTSGHCAPNDYKTLSSFIDKFGSLLFSQADLLLILEYLVDRKLLFAQSSSGTDDVAMRIASFKVIKSLCQPFVHLCDKGISGVLATVQIHCPDKSPQKIGECVRQLCEIVSDSMIAQVDVKLAEEWFLCWEAMLALRDLVVSVLCDPCSHCLHIITKCQIYHTKNPTVQRCFAKMMKACAHTRLQTIYLLEEEKNDLKLQHTKDISVLEKRVQELELAKVRAQEQVRVLSEQNGHESVRLLMEESKANARLQGRVEQLEKENNELQKQKKELQDMLNPISASDRFINQTAKKRGSDSSIVHVAEAGIRKLHRSKVGNFSDLQEDGNGGRDYTTKSLPVTPNERMEPNLRRLSSSPGTVGYHAHDQSLEEYSVHAEGRNRLSLSSNASLDSVFDSDAERDSHPGSMTRAHSWSSTSPPAQRQSERMTRRSCSIPMPIPEDYRTEDDSGREKRFKDVVTKEMKTFVLYTNFDNLGSILRKEKLVNDVELEKITDSRTPAKDRAHYFYTQVLPSKGSDAYSLLRKCLEEEDEHRGHKDLLLKLV